MELWEAILLAAFTGIAGYFGNHFVHQLSVKKDNITINRERFMDNVHKLDNFMKYMIETNYIQSEITKCDELIASLATNIDLLKRELVRIGEEQNAIKEKMNKSCDSQELEKLGTELNLLSEKISNTSSKIEHIVEQLKSISDDDLDRNSKRLDELSEHLNLDNIATGLVLIDPSGKILTYLKELQEIYSDPECLAKNQSKAIMLQTKIESIITEEIKNFGK